MAFQTVPTQYVDVNGVKIAYRRFGKKTETPVLFLTHFRGTMDVIDPLLANSIAQNRELILFDYSGCGHSGGIVQDSLKEAGETAVAFLSSINVQKADLLGFSMGGLTAQIIAEENYRTQG